MEPPEASHVPALYRHHLQRPRLTRLLDSCAAQSIILTAPAGYGKTTLAAEWLSGRETVCWYRLTSGAADVAAFSVGLAQVIAPLVPGTGSRLRQRLRVAEPPENAARPLAELLAEDIARWPDGAWLVLDNYQHVIDSAPVEDFMDWLLMLAPRLRVLATTRRRPGWATARRILYGETAEVTQEQLAMTDQEAAEVLAARPPELTHAVIAQAQGWPTLIGLAALATTAEIPTERVSEELFRYFAEEVLRQQPESVQQFMLLASIPQTLTPALAESALGLDASDRTIARLADEGLLREDPPGHWSFHPLLHDFLRRRLEAEQPSVASALIDRVIAHTRELASWEESFELAISSGRLDVGAEVLGDAAPSLLSAGQIETVEKWLAACGPVVYGHPTALLAQADVALRRGRLTETASRAQDLAVDSSVSDSIRSRSWCLAARAMHLLSRDKETLELARHSLACATTDAEVMESLWTAFLAANDLESAEARSLLLEYTQHAAGDVDVRLRTCTAMILHAQRTGRTDGVAAQAESLLPLITSAKDPFAYTTFVSSFAYLQAQRAYYKEAMELVDIGLTKAREMRVEWVESTNLVARAYVETGLRRFRGARRTARDLFDSGLRLKDMYLCACSRILALRIDLCQMGPSAPDQHSPFRESSVVPHYVQGELASLRALRLAARHDDAGASELAHQALNLTHSVETAFIARFALFIVSYSTSDAKVRDQALRLLKRVVEAEAFDSFVLAYRVHPPILSLALDLFGPENPLSDAAARANDSSLARKCGLEVTMVSDSGLRLSSLTPREVEVLTLIERGFSNAEIAQTLVVEVSTVKSHVHSILRKLGVSTRLQAALTAHATSAD